MMATAGEPAAKDREDDPEQSPPLHQESFQGKEPSEDSSSKSSSSSSSPLSSAQPTARENLPADEGAPPASINRDAAVPLLKEDRQQSGSHDSGQRTALSYFASTGAGKLSFVPPAGVSSQTSLRIHPFLDASSGESLRYYTPTGAHSAEQSAPRRPAAVGETSPQRQETGLVYYTHTPGSYGAVLNSSASSRVSSPTVVCREPGLPPILPASFVQSSCFRNITSQQRFASGGRAAAADAWTPRQQGFEAPAGAPARNSPRLQQQRYGQIMQVDGQLRQVVGTGIHAGYFGGAPGQPEYYMGPREHADMKLPQFYVAAPQSLTENNWSAAAVMKRGQENLPPSRMHSAMPRSSSTVKPESQWKHQPPVLRISRGVRDGESRRGRRTPWDCYGGFMSPRDLLPQLSDSQARLSRSLRANINIRKKDLSRILQRLQDAVCRNYQQLTLKVGVDGTCGGRCPLSNAQHQRMDRGSGLRRREAGEGYMSPRFVDRTSLYYGTPEQQQYSGSQAIRIKDGRDATQKLWKDDAVVYGTQGALPELIYSMNLDQKTMEAPAGADQSIGKTLVQLPRGDVSAMIPQSSGKVVNGPYSSAAASTPSTRACPTCGSSQVLVYVDQAPRREAKSMKDGEGALQRLAHGDLDGCLQRLGEWRCTLCTDVAAAADEEVLHTGGAVQQGGEWVDQMMEFLVHGVADSMRSLFLTIPRPSRQVVEGYPLYEPDYTYLTRKGRPTSLTGNFFVDQINAFLDACLVDQEDTSAVLPKAPPVPDTTPTGHWLIDTANAALDKLCAEAPPLPPPSRRAFCPPIETFLPPCCRGTPLLPPRPPPQTTMCPCLGICGNAPRGPALECPHCHQPLRSGVCPVESPRERKLKKLFDECLSPEREASVPEPPARLYAYEAPPVGYYVPSSPKQPAPEYYAPVYGSSPAIPVGKQTNERLYYTPAAATAGTQGKTPDWAEPAGLVRGIGKAETTDVCQYPYAPVYATQPCSKGFTSPTGERLFVQPRA